MACSHVFFCKCKESCFRRICFVKNNGDFEEVKCRMRLKQNTSRSDVPPPPDWLNRSFEKTGVCGPPSEECGQSTLMYRLQDGSCNNVQKPRTGATFTAFRRELPPDYLDGKYLSNQITLPSCFQASVNSDDQVLLRVKFYQIHVFFPTSSLLAKSEEMDE